VAPLPFQLKQSSISSWFARWTEEKINVAVVGNDEGPHPANLAALEDLVNRWPEVKRAIEAYLRSLVPDGRVPLEGGSTDWHFGASDCGFEGRLFYEVIAVIERLAPTQATVVFYTGYPDGYATYRVVLEAGRPIAISAYCA
jgi:hypothetical protein